jgi:hypothetical protein
MKKMPVLIPFLVFVSALFIGILIWAYVETKKANPQMIEVGQRVSPGLPLTRISPGLRADVAQALMPGRPLDPSRLVSTPGGGTGDGTVPAGNVSGGNRGRFLESADGPKRHPGTSACAT